MSTDTVHKAFEHGKEVVRDSFGDFKNEPEEFEVEEGLLDQDVGGYTASTIDVLEQDDDITLIGSEAEPQRIVIDKDLVEEDPKAAGKTTVHELLEWRAAEELSGAQVREGNTDFIAEFNENYVCVETNNEAGEVVCDVDWSRDYNTIPNAD